jgi:transcriptional regulator with XRE-family HTH domain
MSDFGRELARLMQARGVGVRELARRVPCNPGHISNLRSGNASPSLNLASIIDGILEAGGKLTALADAATPVVPGGGLGLIELARRAEASDLGSGTLELLQESADRLCRDYPVVDPRVLSDQARTRLGYLTDLLGKRVTLAQHR